MGDEKAESLDSVPNYVLLWASVPPFPLGSRLAEPNSSQCRRTEAERGTLAGGTGLGRGLHPEPSRRGCGLPACGLTLGAVSTARYWLPSGTRTYSGCSFYLFAKAPYFCLRILLFPISLFWPGSFSRVSSPRFLGLPSGDFALGDPSPWPVLSVPLGFAGLFQPDLHHQPLLGGDGSAAARHHDHLQPGTERHPAGAGASGPVGFAAWGSLSSGPVTALGPRVGFSGRGL